MAKTVQFKVLQRRNLGYPSAFPVSMLRYDKCYPADENSAALIAHTMDRRINSINFIEIPITLTSHDKHAPHVGRWLSFGWKIVE